MGTNRSGTNRTGTKRKRTGKMRTSRTGTSRTGWLLHRLMLIIIQLFRRWWHRIVSHEYVYTCLILKTFCTNKLEIHHANKTTYACIPTCWGALHTVTRNNILWWCQRTVSTSGSARVASNINWEEGITLMEVEEQLIISIEELQVLVERKVYRVGRWRGLS